MRRAIGGYRMNADRQSRREMLIRVAGATIAVEKCGTPQVVPTADPGAVTGCRAEDWVERFRRQGYSARIVSAEELR